MYLKQTERVLYHFSVGIRQIIFCTDVRPVSSDIDTNKFQHMDCLHFNITFQFHFCSFELLVLPEFVSVGRILSLTEERVKQTCTYSIWRRMLHTKCRVHHGYGAILMVKYRSHKLVKNLDVTTSSVNNRKARWFEH